MKIKIDLNKRIDDPLGGTYWTVKIAGKGPKYVKLTSTYTYFDEETGEDTEDSFTTDIFLPLHRIVEENENFVSGNFTQNDLRNLDRHQYKSVE